MSKIINVIKREYQELIPCSNFSSQWWAYIAIALIWAPAMLSPFVGGVRAFFGDAVKEVFIILLYVIPILGGLKYIASKQSSIEFVFYFACVMIYLCNYILFPENTMYLEKYEAKTLFFVFPMIFIGSLIQKEKLWKLLFYCSCFSVLWNYYYYTHIVVLDDYAGTSQFVSENMTKSYANLPHVLMVLWQTFSKPKIWKIVFSALGVLMVFGFGTRGPLLCTSVFIATYLFFFRTYKNPIIIRMGVVVLLLLFFIFIDIIFEYIGAYVEQIGLSTRIFDYYTGVGIDDANGRDFVRNWLKPYLDSMPIMGYGIWGTYLLVGGYPHNLILDLMLTFGYTGGVFLLMLLVATIIAAIRLAADSNQRGFICLLVCGPAILHLMMSGSFLQSQSFFLLLGYCISIISQSAIFSHSFKISN
jgi:hypothetical protein